jgi:predicted HAD superfamily Cof-like phosphohydrolase
MNLYALVKEFHDKYEIPYSQAPGPLDKKTLAYRIAFMDEELGEYSEASLNCEEMDVEGQLDALVDLVYVAIGTAILHGFDFNEAFLRVHAANMTKVRASKAEDSARGSSLDVIKPDGWTPPYLKDLAGK